MKRKIIILASLVIPTFLFGQNLKFSSSGKMTASPFKIDTILYSSIKSKNTGIVFNRIDSSTLTSLNPLFSALKGFFEKSVADSSEYFYIFNGTKKQVSISRLNKRVVAIEVAQTTNGDFKPVDFFLYPSCGTGIDYSDIVLKPGNILIITSKRLSTRGSYKTIARLKLKTSDGIIPSAAYTSSIDNNSFYLDTGSEKYYPNVEHRITTLDK